MATNVIKGVLLWCVGINYGVMLVWFGLFIYAHDWMYRLHKASHAPLLALRFQHRAW